MKIALIGYGKMGKIIEKLAEIREHEIILKVDIDNRDDLINGRLAEADVAIEFTRPESAVENIKAALEAGVPLVSGTTGWLDHLEEIKTLCAQKKGAFFYASNYSIGVNIFFAINRYLARLMEPQKQYAIEMEEIHHTQKLDAPSGTAITLAQGILNEVSRKKYWVKEESDDAEALPIASKRIDPAPGTHEINYHSAIDSITIRHTAHSREGFATGALMAAEWLVGKEGVFGMEDMLPM
jgi:4-hydroxy-tetrahydrodipicolinate reductase